MFFITVNHFSGGEAWNLKEASVGSIAVYQMYRPLGQVGVDIFVLITGYFLGSKIDSDYGKSLKRAGKVWIEVWFYSIILFILCSLFLGQFFPKGLLKALAPVTFNAYWFVTAYIILVLLIPFINRVLIKLSRESFIVLLLVTIFFAEVVPIFGNNIFSLDKGFGDVLAVYLLGAYFKRFEIKHRAVYLWISVAVLYILMLLSIVAIEKLRGSESNFTRFAYGLFPYLVAAAIFIFFINLPPFTSKVINYLASGVFATYLITVNDNISTVIWTKWFDVTGVTNLLLVATLGVLISLLLVFVTILIDKFRQWIFKRLKVETVLYKLIDLCSNQCKRMLSKTITK